MPEAFIETVAAARRSHPLPLQMRERAEVLARHTLRFLFPHFCSDARCESGMVRDELAALLRLVHETVGAVVDDTTADRVSVAFGEALPAVRESLLDDASALADGDPAAAGVDEVILAYPGFLAIAVHRVSHLLYGRAVPVLPRLMSEWAHRETGIDIHPGAQIGRGFAIDHGTGVVIGETTQIGDRVRIYQGVTLGALAVHKRLAHSKRHPTIGDDVVIYANATILGGETLVGSGSIIGGNVWLTHSVPPRSRVHFESKVEHRPVDDGIEFHI